MAIRGSAFRFGYFREVVTVSKTISSWWRNGNADKGRLRLSARTDTGDHSIFPRGDKVVDELVQFFPVHKRPDVGQSSLNASIGSMVDAVYAGMNEAIDPTTSNTNATPT